MEIPLTFLVFLLKNEDGFFYLIPDDTKQFTIYYTLCIL